jgi:hypothetical protein
MIETNINIEVHCARPNWVFLSFPIVKQFDISYYRLYIDSDLLTERTWIWDNNTFIKEDIWINTEPNIEHIIKIEPIVKNPAQAQFELLNFKVVNKNYQLNRLDINQISFKIQ